MKIRILTLLLLVMELGFLTNCYNDYDDDELEIEFESNAIISGFDMALCPCCGGWIINIEEEESDNRFTELPQDSNIDLDNVIFPISVRLNWTESDEYCGIGILVESIELIE